MNQSFWHISSYLSRLSTTCASSDVQILNHKEGGRSGGEVATTPPTRERHLTQTRLALQYKYDI